MYPLLDFYNETDIFIRGKSLILIATMRPYAIKSTFILTDYFN